MKHYAPLSIVSECALNAIFDYGLSCRPDIVEQADMIAILRRTELTAECVEEAFCLMEPRFVN